MRGLFGAMARGTPRLVTKSGAGGQLTWNSILPFGAVKSATGLNISQASAMTVSTVYACVTIRSRDVARCQPSLYRPLASGARERVDDHAVAKLMIRPNRVQTWFEFAQQMWAAYLLRSNAYAAILRDSRGNPTELIPINPDLVSVLEAADGSIFYQTARYGLWLNNVLASLPYAIPAEDVMHIRDLSFNTLMAPSKISIARDSIGVAMALEQQAARWVGNAARPSGVLMTDKRLDKVAADRLKEEWHNANSSLANTGGTPVLEFGVKWQKLELTSVDLEFIAQREFSVLDVARFFNMPPRKLAIQDTSRGSTVIQEEQDYVNQTVAPDLTMWEQKFARTFDLDLQGLKVVFSTADLLRADALTRLNTGRVGIISGILTPNEVRVEENRAPMEGGDKLLAPSNTAALGSDATGLPADGGGRPPAGQAPNPGVDTSGTSPLPVGDPEPFDS